jgi:DNA helicase HerA-like ATPase
LGSFLRRIGYHADELEQKRGRMEYTNITQPRRLLHLVLYVGVLFSANYSAFNQWLPYADQRGLWFFGGLAALVIGSLIVTPFFTSPANAISYAVAGLVAVLCLKPTDRSLFPAFAAVSTFCSVVLVFGVLNIALKDRGTKVLRNLSNTSRILADLLGNPRTLYAIILVYSLYCFHRQSASEMLWISVAGIIIIAARPLEALDNAITSALKVWLSDPKVTRFGSIVAYQTPNIVLIRQESNEADPFKRSIVLNDPHTSARLGITLDFVGRDEGMLLRAIQVPVSAAQREYVQAIVAQLPQNTAATVEPTVVTELSKQNSVLASASSLVGIVAPDTSIERLYFEVVEERDLEEGRLVETVIFGRRVIYQIIDGLTKEEVVQQKNTFGYARAQARKIGFWDSETRRFIPSKWLPNPNSPVFLKSPDEIQSDHTAVGYFPGSAYPVSIKNMSELVTHNTAILGILGVGKSMLAIELVERMIAEGIKVICIDLTNQYQTELLDFYEVSREQTAIATLQAVGCKGKTAYKKNVEEGGSIREFAQEMFKDVASFADPLSQHRLKIYNPNEFEVWRQDSKIYQETASMASLTPTEITRIITESALRVCRSQGMTDKARLCIVFEEAHSLIPEWTTVAAEGDKEATNGTARAILQGRKYGLGCILVTQRTANVTKTILNQCNTIFAMRTFDETGKEFLSNYFGGDYATLLSSLHERHAVLFGRASSCENPVLIRLNDQDKFRKAFRAVHPPIALLQKS